MDPDGIRKGDMTKLRMINTTATKARKLPQDSFFFVCAKLLLAGCGIIEEIFAFGHGMSLYV